MNYQHLIDQARSLSVPRGRGALRQVALRRAVSAAYYALFHFLIGEACREFLGRAPKDRMFRATLARAFDHGDMAEASKPFKARNLPVWMVENFGGDVPIPLAHVAATFIDLQENRHRADYDRAARFRLEDVNELIDRVEEAIVAWDQIQGLPMAKLYLLMLLTWRQVKSRKMS